MDEIVIKGAREHNLKGFDLVIPRDKFVVITGVSGSGKSSLAFDTIYAEGQRRYVESLSAYARQFLEQMNKPDVESIEGLSPAISIEQKTTSRNPRSTVGTVTEVYDYLRLLYARIGRPHCYECGEAITSQSVTQMVDSVMELKKGTKAVILAPIVTGRKGEHKKELENLRREGFTRVKVDGVMKDLEGGVKMDKRKKHNIDVVIDRLVIKEGITARLADSLEVATRLSGGIAKVDVAQGKDLLFNEKLACPRCSISYSEITPTTFSFNSPYGACEECKGLGEKFYFDPDLVIPDDNLSIGEGAVVPWAKKGGRTSRKIAETLADAMPDKGGVLSGTSPGTKSGLGGPGGQGGEKRAGKQKSTASSARGSEKPSSEGAKKSSGYYSQMLEALGRHYDFSLEVPFNKLSKKVQGILLHGSGKEEIEFEYESRKSRYTYSSAFEGVLKNLERRYHETESNDVRSDLERYMNGQPCPECNGTRLKREGLYVRVGGRSIVEVTDLSIKDCVDFFKALKLTKMETEIGARILKEIGERLGFLSNVGLDYITLGRSSSTLSGGEGQRIRLATQIGSSLVGVLYVLDEPSIGLHQRDNRRLLKALARLRDMGNTVLVVEHDEETMEEADYIIDMGPGAGALGGTVVAQGTASEIMESDDSITGKYLSGEIQIPVPAKRERKKAGRKKLVLKGLKENNLKNIDVRIPIGLITCVTGVSGSGKSTLVVDTLYRTLARELYNSKVHAGAHKSIKGLEYVDKVIDIDQTPIGRTPRSNPATYTGLFTPIRELFSQLPDSKVRGYTPGRFSFNVKGGRCESCTGDGMIKVEMHFLPDVYVRCEVCDGHRYNRETLDIRYKGKNIAEVLEMSIGEALDFFQNIPTIKEKLKTLCDVGLDYIKIGQPATTLSGGEAQRIKLSKELSKRATGKTLYILDEPTTGLHFADIHKLLEVLHRLRTSGNTVVIIEHNLDVIKSADHIIDLGPEGGDGGGEIIATGTPEDVAKVTGSHTGEVLKRALRGGGKLA